MNFNLIKKIAQNSKKCNNIAYNFLNYDGLCVANGARHNSTLATLQNKYLPREISVHGKPQRRCYCEENGPPPAPSQKLPPLMEFRMAVWPSVFKSLKNIILTTFIIKPYLDPEFSLADFIVGSKRAIQVVSHKLAEGDSLEGLVTPDIIPNLQEKVSGMTLMQRDLIPVNFDDIYLSFPYQIGIIFNEDEIESQKRFVEITMVYHVLKGLATARAQGNEPPLNLGLLPEYQDKISICNYRYIKEFTKGVESDWTINLLNHYRPIDEEF